MISLIIAVALLFDALVGEVRRWHPLVGFGQLANWVEMGLNRQKLPTWLQTLSGIIALLLLITPLVMIFLLLDLPLYLEVCVSIVVLYFAIGYRSLIQHAQQIKTALNKNNLLDARNKTSMIVSRDTDTMKQNDMAKATVESILENGSDAIFASLFWFLVAGIPGVLLHRSCNTLDAMWGYRSNQFRYFGWAAAKLDDILNFIPARLTALSYAICGHFITAIRSWFQQARHWESPNAGPVMASGAGALMVQIGGSARYHGQEKSRALLGKGKDADMNDIDRALKLLFRSILLWVCVIAGVDYFA